MTGLVLGLILGALVGGATVYAYQRQRTRKLREDRHLLAARLRSLVALMDTGLLEVQEPGVKKMLLDTRTLLADGMPLDRAADGDQRRRTEPRVEDDEEELPPLFDRSVDTGSQR